MILGTATASHAGVRFNIGIPFPAPPAVVVAPPAPVYIQPYVAPAAPVCAPAPPVVIAPPPVVVAPPVVTFRFGHPGYWHRGYDYHHGYYHRW